MESCLRVVPFPLPRFQTLSLLPEPVRRNLRAPRGTRSLCAGASTSAPGFPPPPPPPPPRLQLLPRMLRPPDLLVVLLSLVQVATASSAAAALVLRRLLPTKVVVGPCSPPPRRRAGGPALSVSRRAPVSTPGSRSDDEREGLQSQSSEHREPRFPRYPAGIDQATIL